MSSLLSALDRVEIAVPDLVQAKADFEDLGFLPREVGDRLVIDLLGQALILRQEGADFAAGRRRVGFNAEDWLATLDWLKARGYATAHLPLGGNVELPAELTPGFEAMLCEATVRAPALHPNGASGIASVTAVHDDPERLPLILDRLFQPGASVLTDNTLALHTKRGMVLLSHPEELEQLHPDHDFYPPPVSPAIAAVTLSIGNSDAAAEWIGKRGVPFTRDQLGCLRFEPEEAAGLVLELTPLAPLAA